CRVGLGAVRPALLLARSRAARATLRSRPLPLSLARTNACARRDSGVFNGVRGTVAAELVFDPDQVLLGVQVGQGFELCAWQEPGGPGCEGVVFVSAAGRPGVGLVVLVRVGMGGRLLGWGCRSLVRGGVRRRWRRR